jgi:hypothetical protein
VLVVTTLGAPQRRFMERARSQRRPAEPEPEPAAVLTTRATVIDVAAPLDLAAAEAWLEAAGEDELEAGLEVLNRAMHAFRVVTADASVMPVTRPRALAARVGYGAGEEVADGLWTAATELLWSEARVKRAVALQPVAHLAAVLTGHQQVLVCQSLILRARDDWDSSRAREAALQVMIALDAAIAELAGVAELQARVDELREQREPAAAAAQEALAGPLGPDAAAAVEHTLRRLEAAMRARLVGLA